MASFSVAHNTRLAWLRGLAVVCVPAASPRCAECGEQRLFPLQEVHHAAVCFTPLAGAGPLHGVRVVEFAALGPAPMAAMLLADLGAEVVRIERKTAAGRLVAELFDPQRDILNRSRHTLALDLKPRPTSTPRWR